MKTHKIIATAALMAVVATACTKDTLSIRLFSEPMTGGAKVLVDPTAVNDAQWVTGEQINLNGTARTITQHDGHFYLDLDAPIDGALTAVYPASIDANGDSVTYSASTVTINNLNIDFVAGGHRIIFPMAAEAAAGSESLKFDHLTGGLKLTLSDTATNSGYTLGSLRIVTYGDGSMAAPIAPRHGITATWAVQGPAVPGSMVGETNGDVSVVNASEMHFTFSTDGTPGKAIADGGSISFCVPITVNSVKTLEVTGYSPDGVQLFSRTKTLDDVLKVQANTMYTIPEIEF